jgi:hypothetical protein
MKVQSIFQLLIPILLNQFIEAHTIWRKNCGPGESRVIKYEPMDEATKVQDIRPERASCAPSTLVEVHYRRRPMTIIETVERNIEQIRTSILTVTKDPKMQDRGTTVKEKEYKDGMVKTVTIPASISTKTITEKITGNEEIREGEKIVTVEKMVTETQTVTMPLQGQPQAEVVEGQPEAPTHVETLITMEHSYNCASATGEHIQSTFVSTVRMSCKHHAVTVTASCPKETREVESTLSPSPSPAEKIATHKSKGAAPVKITSTPPPGMQIHYDTITIAGGKVTTITETLPCGCTSGIDKDGKTITVTTKKIGCTHKYEHGKIKRETVAKTVPGCHKSLEMIKKPCKHATPTAKGAKTEKKEKGEKEKKEKDKEDKKEKGGEHKEGKDHKDKKEGHKDKKEKDEKHKEDKDHKEKEGKEKGHKESKDKHGYEAMGKGEKDHKEGTSEKDDKDKKDKKETDGEKTKTDDKKDMDDHDKSSTTKAISTSGEAEPKEKDSDHSSSTIPSSSKITSDISEKQTSSIQESQTTKASSSIAITSQSKTDSTSAPKSNGSTTQASTTSAAASKSTCTHSKTTKT